MNDGRENSSANSSEQQNRIFLKLVLDLLEVLEWHKLSAFSERNELQPQNRKSLGLPGKEESMNKSSRTLKIVVAAIFLMPLFESQFSMGQSINDEKKAVVFIFGTIHPLNPDKTAMRDITGKVLAVEIPLGTGFFVNYSVLSGRHEHRFTYLVTAKHVLQDTDGTLLPSVTVRLNLKTSAGGSEVGFIRDIPVTGPQGSLLWLQSEDRAEDVVAVPLSPDGQQFEFTTISTRTFLKDRALNSGGLAEGDELYFIGLMEQYYGIKRNYPVVRRGTLALITDEYIETPSGQQKVFIAELESWPGNSGSPVFLRRGDRAGSSMNQNSSRFLGMIIASFVNKFSASLSAEQPTQKLEGGDKANIGMSCIVPAAIIEKVLNSAPAQQDRDERMQR